MQLSCCNLQEASAKRANSKREQDFACETQLGHVSLLFKSRRLERRSGSPHSIDAQATTFDHLHQHLESLERAATQCFGSSCSFCNQLSLHNLACNSKTRRLRHKSQQRGFSILNCNHLPNILPVKGKTKPVLILKCLLLLPLLVLLPQTMASIQYNYPTNQIANKNSGQFFISQLCMPRSQFPVSRRVEGALLAANHSDIDVNCTITFRTKSAQQHFVIRFEELKLGCDDHLIMFDSDVDYGQQSINDFSCRDNMASVPLLKTTGTFLTLRYTSDDVSKLGDGFRLIVTAVFDSTMSLCPPEYASCRNQLCISRSLFCDDVNHCVDNSDEIGCQDPGHDPNDLSYALALLVVLVLVISACVIVFIATIYCRRENPYAQYQHHLGVPMQTSSSLMFPHVQHQNHISNQQHLHHQQQPHQQHQFIQPVLGGQHHIFRPQPIIVQYRNAYGSF